MTHWGWYWKVKKQHVARKLCSSFAAIDSFKLYQKNNIIAGFIVEPLAITVEAYSSHLKITYRKRKEYSYTIPVERISCNYGGFRSYFRCPLCEKRMRILYFAEQSIFLCRMCLNLSYNSQRLRTSRRYGHISDQIKAFVREKGGDLDQYKKPPRMHNTSYDKLRQKQCYYESKFHQALNNELRKWYGERVEPYIDKYFDYVDELENGTKSDSTAEHS